MSTESDLEHRDGCDGRHPGWILCEEAGELGQQPSLSASKPLRSKGGRVIGSAEGKLKIDTPDAQRVADEARAERTGLQSELSPSSEWMDGYRAGMDEGAQNAYSHPERITVDDGNPAGPLVYDLGSVNVALQRERDELRDLLWSVSGQLAGFAEEYRDPDGRDCKVAVAHLIASDIEKYLKGETNA